MTTIWIEYETTIAEFGSTREGHPTHQDLPSAFTVDVDEETWERWRQARDGFWAMQSELVRLAIEAGRGDAYSDTDIHGVMMDVLEDGK